MMKAITIFPNLASEANNCNNPYIKDYITSINQQQDLYIKNPPHKNPLKSILMPNKWGDVFIFNWFENIPDFKYGMLQSFTAIIFILVLKLFRKKIIWMLHNKKSHRDGKRWIKSLLANLIANYSSIIITHSQEGVELVKQQYPKAINKTYFLHHPTKNRIHLNAKPNSKQYDVLIWGTITPYKRVVEFIKNIKQPLDNPLNICIVGNGSKKIIEEIKQYQTEHITLIPKSLSFEELRYYMSQSEFVLCTYNPETILSSGMLMDSLSFGAKVIGPDVGSFRDYAHHPLLKVYTFNSLNDIPSIVRKHENDKVSLENYIQFLTENDWNHFIKQVKKLIN